ncbi:unnamed protein product, partial [Porites evermanni]
MNRQGVTLLLLLNLSAAFDHSILLDRWMLSDRLKLNDDKTEFIIMGTRQQLAKLQRVQNAAARLICKVRRFDHITPILFSLHWLPVRNRIQFK